MPLRSIQECVRNGGMVRFSSRFIFFFFNVYFLSDLLHFKFWSNLESKIFKMVFFIITTELVKRKIMMLFANVLTHAIWHSSMNSFPSQQREYVQSSTRIYLSNDKVSLFPDKKEMASMKMSLCSQKFKLLPKNSWIPSCRPRSESPSHRVVCWTRTKGFFCL